MATIDELLKSAEDAAERSQFIKRLWRKKYRNLPMLDEKGRPRRERLALKISESWDPELPRVLLATLDKPKVYFWRPTKVWRALLRPGMYVVGSWALQTPASPKAAQELGMPIRNLTYGRGVYAGTGFLWGGRKLELQHPERRLKDVWTVQGGKQVFLEGTWNPEELWAEAARQTNIKLKGR